MEQLSITSLHSTDFVLELGNATDSVLVTGPMLVTGHILVTDPILVMSPVFVMSFVCVTDPVLAPGPRSVTGSDKRSSHAFACLREWHLCQGRDSISVFLQHKSKDELNNVRYIFASAATLSLKCTARSIRQILLSR